MPSRATLGSASQFMAQPPFVPFLLLLAAVGLAVAFILVPPGALYRHVAPTAYAEHTLRTSYGVEAAVYPGCLGTPELTWAWQQVSRAPDAAARFERILDGGSPTGRVYALAGLQRVAPDRFIERVAAYDTAQGVVAWRPPNQDWQHRPLADIVQRDVRSGHLASVLAAAPLTTPTCVE